MTRAWRRAGGAAAPAAAGLPADLSCTIWCPQEIDHASYLVAGVEGLARAGSLRARFRLDTRPHPGEVRTDGGRVELGPSAPYKVTYVELRTAGRRVRLAVDFWDRADRFSQHALETCDVVVKREFDPVAVDLVRRRHPNTDIVPGGLTHTAPLGRHRRRVEAAFAAATTRRLVKLDRDAPARLGRALRAARSGIHRSRRRLAVTEMQDLVPAGLEEPMVLYQTRTFPDPDGAIVDLHRRRAHLVRLLRAELGGAFRGGIVADGDAPLDPELADCASDIPSDPRPYTAAVAGAAVVVSSADVAGSTPWKLAEFLALGASIVSERPATLLPEPLLDGRHALLYDAPEEVPDLCRRLLADPAARAELAAGARRYYEDHVRPDQAVGRWFRQALQRT